MNFTDGFLYAVRHAELVKQPAVRTVKSKPGPLFTPRVSIEPSDHGDLLRQIAEELASIGRGNPGLWDTRLAPLHDRINEAI